LGEVESLLTWDLVGGSVAEPALHTINGKGEKYNEVEKGETRKLGI
jgi:hypothetical protein